MKYREMKFSFFGLVMALVYWLIDSSVHYLYYEEPVFEFIPAEINELWMRVVIVVLVVGFGIYADICVKRTQRLSDEQYQLQLKLDQSLTKLLSGYLSICSVCKRVKVKGELLDKNAVWENIESYISERSDMKFTHGYCPDCAKKARREIRKKDKK